LFFATEFTEKMEGRRLERLEARSKKRWRTEGRRWKVEDIDFDHWNFGDSEFVCDLMLGIWCFRLDSVGSSQLHLTGSFSIFFRTHLNT